MMESHRFMASVFGRHGPPQPWKGGRWLSVLSRGVFLGTIVAPSSGPLSDLEREADGSGPLRADSASYDASRGDAGDSLP
jgi:hypothetical protein